MFSLPLYVLYMFPGNAYNITFVTTRLCSLGEMLYPYTLSFPSSLRVTGMQDDIRSSSHATNHVVYTPYTASVCLALFRPSHTFHTHFTVQPTVPFPFPRLHFFLA